MMSLMRLGLIWLSILQRFEAADRAQCASCASPQLQSKWHVTGLPSYDAEMPFTEKCLLSGAPRMSDKCGGLCFEMTFPLDGSQQIVRGCYEDFVRSIATTQDTEQCEYSVGNASTSLGIYSTSTPVVRFFLRFVLRTHSKTSMRFCDWSSLPTNSDACNNRYYAGTLYGDAGTLQGNRSVISKFCAKEVKDSITCRSCAAFGDSGKCTRSTGATCSDGRYCAKLSGTVGDNEFKMRGCVKISPFPKSDSYCAPIDSTLGVPTFLDMPAFAEDFKGTVCVCNDRDECNAAASFFGGVWAATTLAALALTGRP